jgi:hypothetical protein
MAWYSTGTLTLVNGSTTVVGVGTDFISGANVGEALYLNDNLYEIGAIVSATQLTLVAPYLGSTDTGVTYKIIPTQSLVADLAAGVSDLITDYSDVKDTAGEGKFNDGTVTAPGITFEGDQNTGIYKIDADNFGLTAGGQKIVDVSTSGIKLDDNNKITLGTGNDLQIYHDGNSWIKDSGTGNLVFDTNGNGMFFKHGDETLFEAYADGAVNLRHDDSTKLATTATGVDVTGTVTADGLTVDTGGTGLLSTLIGSSDNRALTINNYDADFAGSGYSFNAVSSGGEIALQTTSTDRFKVKSNGDVHLFEDTGTTAKFVWDSSAESLGIGTASPQKDVHIISANGGSIRLERNDSSLVTDDSIGSIDFRQQDPSSDGAGVVSKIESINESAFRGFAGLSFSTGDTATLTERMRINGSGNVGIGTNSPIAKLTVDGQVRASGTAGYGFNSPGDTDGGMFSPSDGVVSFKTNGTERARIDSSGNLLVGTTNSEGKKLSIRGSYGISDETTKTITLTVAMGGSQTKNIGTFTGSSGKTCSVHLTGGHHYSTASTGTGAPVGVYQMMAVTRLDGTGSAYSSINNVEVASSLKGSVALPTLEFTSSGLLRVVTASNQGCYAQLTIVHNSYFTRS